AYLQFLRQMNFRVLGHIDDFPALVDEPLRLGAGREPWSLDCHHGTGRVHSNASGLACFKRQVPELGTIWIGARDVSRNRTIVKGIDAPAGSVDELVADDEIAGLGVLL